MAQQDYTSLIVLGAAGAFAWYAYEQGWFSSLLPAAAAPAVAPAQSTAQVALSVNILNNTTGNASVFRIGDMFTVTVTGPPNSPVTVSGTQSGSAFGPISE